MRILSVDESAAHWRSRAVTGVRKRRRSTDILDQVVKLSFPSSQGLAEFSAEDVEEYAPTKKAKPSTSETSSSTPQSDSSFVPDYMETPLDLTLKVRPEPDIILELPMSCRYQNQLSRLYLSKDTLTTRTACGL